VVVEPQLQNLAFELGNVSLPVVKADVPFNKCWLKVSEAEDSLRNKDAVLYAQIQKEMFEEQNLHEEVKIDGFDQNTSSHKYGGLNEIEILDHLKEKVEALENKDNKMCDSDIDKSRKVLESMNTMRRTVKPSFFCPAMEWDSCEQYSDWPEQNMALDLLMEASHLDIPYISELGNSCRRIRDNPVEWKMFTQGYLTLNLPHEEAKSRYHRMREEAKGQSNPIGFEEFCVQNKFMPERRKDLCFARGKKCISFTPKNPISIAMWNKSGADKKKKGKREYKIPGTVDMSDATSRMNRMISYLDNVYPRKGNPPFSQVFEGVGSDQPEVRRYKEEALLKGKALFNLVKDFGWHHFLRYSSLFYDQILHLGNESLPSKSVHVFNCGLKNMVCIMTGGYRGMAQASGKSFLYLIKTRNPSLYTSGLFGKTRVFESGEYCFITTPWLRLPGHRIEFMRDSYGSVMASSLCSLNRMNPEPEDVQGILGVRSLFSLIQSTRFIEMAADARYAITSAVATYTNFTDLIADKFCPPYRNDACAWLVCTLLEGLKRFRASIYKSGGVMFVAPVFDEFRKRNARTTGGKLNCVGIWTSRKIRSMQDLMDETFVYTHTPKEPALTFHENLRAVRTIEKFDDEYKKLTSSRKSGILKDKHELNNLLHPDTNVGFSSTFLKAASEYYMSSRFIDKTGPMLQSLKEPISQICSTKAIIKDGRPPAKPVADDVLSARKWYKLAGKEGLEHSKELLKASTARPEKPRVKVHDVLAHKKNLKPTVWEEALEHARSKAEPKVIADICIKAQYGSKREFYVMNYGAKVMSRVCETYFKGICKQSPNEMISVPGDTKFLHIQKLLDRQTYRAQKDGKKLMFVNGDCSKWSASETMEALETVIDVTTEGLPDQYRNFLFYVMECWKKKEVHVPQELVSKVITRTILENKIQPEQNFLQGVFNYLSSLKSDIAHTYTDYIWSKWYPDSELHSEYLVHSDDYTIAVTCGSQEEFVKYRCLHKYVLRLCGIKDSSKKTNCQYVFLEFISLFGFNGSMCYPTIKKTKECTTSLPSEGFADDSDFVCSRTSECLRVGVDFQSSYIFHRIHSWVLRKQYSLEWVQSPFDTPVELFGQSDMHPIFYQMCKGDPNNYRIYTYSNCQELVDKVYTRAVLSPNIGDEWAGRFRPRFAYNRYNSRIRDIRKAAGISAEEALEFWESMPSYSYTKPQDVSDFQKWAKCKYFVNSFVKAYNQDTRTIRALRLSLFSKGKCMTLMSDRELVNFYNTILPTRNSMKTKEWVDNMLTMKEFYHEVVKSDKKYEEKDIIRYVLAGDSTVVSIYGWMDTRTISVTEIPSLGNTVATRIASRPKWINVANSTATLMQYIDDSGLAVRNYPGCDIPSLKEDIDKLTKSYPYLMEQCRTGDRRLAFGLLNNMLSCNQTSTTIAISAHKESSTFYNFLQGQFEIFYNPTRRVRIRGPDMTSVIDPYTGIGYELLGRSAVSSAHRCILGTLGLAYSFLKLRMKMKHHEVKDYLSKCTCKEGLVFDLLSEIDLDICRSNGFTRPEKMTAAYMKLSLLDDPDLALQLLDKDTFFKYGWDNSEEPQPGVGTLRLYIQYRNSTGVFRVSWGSETKGTQDSYHLSCDTFSAQKAKAMFIIGLTLLNKLPKGRLSSNLQNEIPMAYKKTMKFKNRGHYMTPSLKIISVEKNEERLCFPIRMGHQVKWKGNYRHYTYNSERTVVSRNLSLYSGALKLYTLPIGTMVDLGNINFPPLSSRGMHIDRILNDCCSEVAIRHAHNWPNDLNYYLDSDSGYVPTPLPIAKCFGEKNVPEVSRDDILASFMSVGTMDSAFFMDFDQLEILEPIEENSLFEADDHLPKIEEDSLQLVDNRWSRPWTIALKENKPEVYVEVRLEQINAPKHMDAKTAFAWQMCSQLLEEKDPEYSSIITHAVSQAVHLQGRKPINGHSVRFKNRQPKLYKANVTPTAIAMKHEKKGRKAGVLFYTVDGTEIKDGEMCLIEDQNIFCDVPAKTITPALKECLLSSELRWPKDTRWLRSSSLKAKEECWWDDM
jgi:hypothetical protein